jgi:hypothetical protein
MSPRRWHGCPEGNYQRKYHEAMAKYQEATGLGSKLAVAHALFHFYGQTGGEHVRNGHRKWTHFDPPRDRAEFEPVA